MAAKVGALQAPPRAATSFLMDIRNGFTDTIGNTPLIRLHKASELTGCTILGKVEFLNPGGSVKDRMAPR